MSAILKDLKDTILNGALLSAILNGGPLVPRGTKRRTTPSPRDDATTSFPSSSASGNAKSALRNALRNPALPELAVSSVDRDILKNPQYGRFIHVFNENSPTPRLLLTFPIEQNWIPKWRVGRADKRAGLSCIGLFRPVSDQFHSTCRICGVHVTPCRMHSVLSDMHMS